jgi:hypothetical protein
MSQPGWQMNLWKHIEENFEKVVIKIKLGGVLIFLFTLIIFFAGYFVGNKNKTHDVLYAADFGYNMAVKKIPGANLSQDGITNCVDQGNAYFTKKVSAYTFQIVRRQQPMEER